MLKSNSRQSLKGKWGTACLVMCIPLLLTTILSSIMMAYLQPRLLHMANFLETIYGDSFDLLLENPMILFRMLGSIYLFYGILLVITFFVIGPLQMGTTQWHLQATRGNIQPVSKIFHFFENGKRYFRALGYQFQIGIRQFGWALLFFLVPYLLMIVFVVVAIGTGMSEDSAIAIALLIFFLLFLVSMFFYSVFMNKYQLTIYLLAEDDETPISTMIRRSCTETKGYRFSLLWFSLSFIGWLILVSMASGFIGGIVGVIAGTFGALSGDFGFLESTGFTVLTSLIANLLTLPLSGLLNAYIANATAMYGRYILETNARPDASGGTFYPQQPGGAYPPYQAPQNNQQPPYPGAPYGNGFQAPQPPNQPNPYGSNTPPQQPPYQENPYDSNTPPQQPTYPESPYGSNTPPQQPTYPESPYDSNTPPQQPTYPESPYGSNTPPQQPPAAPVTPEQPTWAPPVEEEPSSDTQWGTSPSQLEQETEQEDDKSEQ